jgi:hypothetical protein
MRKWQTRKLVTIDGEQRYTDWEDVELSGTFTGTWRLQWVRNDSGVGENHLILYAPFDALDDEGNGWMAYSYNGLFDYDSTTTYPPHLGLPSPRRRWLDKLPARRRGAKFLNSQTTHVLIKI